MNEKEVFLTEIHNCPRAELYLTNIRLKSEEEGLLNEWLIRRSRGQPLQYILRKADFMDFSLRVEPGVFIPRPETEILVEAVLNSAKSLMADVRSLNILEIGTGSGCIAISLAKHIPSVKITATDVSGNALKIARENSRISRTDDKIEFIRADIFNIKYETLNSKRFDIIVSNPPYIPSGQVEELPVEVRFEPRIALDGGEEGLDFYFHIIKIAPDFLKGAGLLFFEMGYGQSQGIKNIFKKSGKFMVVDIIKDYSNIDRVMVARKLNFKSS